MAITGPPWGPLNVKGQFGEDPLLLQEIYDIRDDVKDVYTRKCKWCGMIKFKWSWKQYYLK